MNNPLSALNTITLQLLLNCYHQWVIKETISGLIYLPLRTFALAAKIKMTVHLHASVDIYTRLGTTSLWKIVLHSTILQFVSYAVTRAALHQTWTTTMLTYVSKRRDIDELVFMVSSKMLFEEIAIVMFFSLGISSGFLHLSVSC